MGATTIDAQDGQGPLTPIMAWGTANPAVHMGQVKCSVLDTPQKNPGIVADPQR